MELDPFLKEALIGLLLGDLYATRSSPTSSTRLVFEQSMIHSEYLMYLYSLFESFVTIPPRSPSRKVHKETGNIHQSLMFKTLYFPCFN
jgi:hypothetical protein